MLSRRERAAKDAADRRVLRRAGLTSMAVVAVVGTLIVAVVLARSPFDRAHRTARGTIEDARIAAAGAYEGRHGGRIVYELDVLVRYTADGAEQERWMPAVYPYTRQMMEARVAHLPAACEVFWAPRHPEHAKCRFYDDFK